MPTCTKTLLLSQCKCNVQDEQRKNSICFCLSKPGFGDYLNQRKVLQPTNIQYFEQNLMHFQSCSWTAKLSTNFHVYIQTFVPLLLQKSQVILSTYWRRNAVRMPRNFWLQCSGAQEFCYVTVCPRGPFSISLHLMQPELQLLQPVIKGKPMLLMFTLLSFNHIRIMFRRRWLR